MIKSLKATRRRADAPKQGSIGDGFLINWMAERQRLIVLNLIATSEEGKFFKEKLAELTELIKGMPGPGEQSSHDDPTVYLHYLARGCDWYIMERDSTPVQNQAFGWVILHGDTWNAEMGYVSIAELISLSDMELDFHFSPKPLSEVKSAKGC